MKKQALTPTEYRQKLLSELSATFDGLQRTRYLSLIFDQDWYARMQEEINNADLDDTFRSNRGFMFFEMNHWLRGVPWFEDAQSKALCGAGDELSEKERLVIAFIGLDPLLVEVPLFERRLEAIADIPSQEDRLFAKIRQLKHHKHTLEFRNHFYELMVLGEFALQGVLREIEVALPGTSSTVDGRLWIDNRDLFVEATFTSQEIFHPPPKGGVFSVNFQNMLSAAISKIEKKAAAGKQLAVVEKVPTLLAIGRGPTGPDAVAYSEAAKDCFRDRRFKTLSAILISDSWKFSTRFLLTNKAAEVPLTRKECLTLQAGTSPSNEIPESLPAAHSDL